jgi:hypothetical protein
MRSRYRTVLVALLAVLAVSAVASTSASAHEFLVEGKAVTTPVAFEGSGPSKIALTGLYTVECTAGVAGHLEERGESPETISFTECKVVGAATCRVRVGSLRVEGRLTIFQNALGALFELDPESVLDISVESCSLAEVFKGELVGKYQCELDAHVEVEQAEHEVICAAAGNELKWRAGYTIAFTNTEKVKLGAPNTGKKWRAKA